MAAQSERSRTRLASPAEFRAARRTATQADWTGRQERPLYRWIHGHLFASECQITACQIQKACAVIFVCKDPSHQKNFVINAFEPAMHSLFIGQSQGVDAHK